MHYYEVTQPRFTTFYFDVVWPQIGVGIDRLGPHVESSQLAVDGTLALRSSWASLTSDHRLESHLALYQRQMLTSSEILAELQEVVGSLLRRIRMDGAGA